LRHPDGASNPNLKEEIERIPGNGASGSDPEEEYIEAKKLFTAAERTVTGKSDIEEDVKIQGTNPRYFMIFFKCFYIFYRYLQFLIGYTAPLL